jgi:phosphatidylserine/phosphatidylglycerophosphate/cardiolipin synthase-like enzyme
MLKKEERGQVSTNKHKKKSDEENRSKYCNCRREYVNLLDNKKQRWQEMNSEKMNYMFKHRDTRKIWIALRKRLKKGVNIEYLDPDRCLSHFATLFTNNNDGILLKEAQILGPGYNDKLDDVFTTSEVRNFILEMKNNKASGCDGLPTEVWKRLIIKDEGILILTKLFNMIRNKRVFPKE